MSTNPNVAQRLQALRLQYPGLIPEEALLARAWMDLYERQYSGFQFNVRIGAGDDPGPSYAAYARENAIVNSKLRLDAVAWQYLKPGYVLQDDTPPATTYLENPIAVPTLMEFKRRAATSAVSQLLAYQHIWAEDFPDQIQPALLLIANVVSPTIVPILKRAGIELVTVQADFSLLRRLPVIRPPVTP